MTKPNDEQLEMEAAALAHSPPHDTGSHNFAGANYIAHTSFKSGWRAREAKDADRIAELEHEYAECNEFNKQAMIKLALAEKRIAKLEAVLCTFDNEFMVKYQVARSLEDRGYYSYTWQSFDHFLKLIREALK